MWRLELPACACRLGFMGLPALGPYSFGAALAPGFHALADWSGSIAARSLQACIDYEDVKDACRHADWHEEAVTTQAEVQTCLLSYCTMAFVVCDRLIIVWRQPVIIQTLSHFVKRQL